MKFVKMHRKHPRVPAFARYNFCGVCILNKPNNGQPRDRKRVAALLNQHFDDWRGDRVVFYFLLVLSVLFTVSSAFISAEIPSAFARLLFWWLILAQLYILFGWPVQ